MATAMPDGGTDIRFVQEMLGHAEIATTQIYTHVSIRQLQRVYATSHPAAFAERHPLDDGADADVDDTRQLLLALAAEAAEEDAPTAPEPVSVDRFLHLRTVRRQRLPGAVTALGAARRLAVMTPLDPLTAGLDAKRTAMLLRDARSILCRLDVIASLAIATGDPALLLIAEARDTVERLVTQLGRRGQVRQRQARDAVRRPH